MPPPPPPLPKLVLILSPAKTLDLSDRHVARDDPIEWTEPLELCQAKTRQVAETMKEHAAEDADFPKFCKLLHISAKLGQTARDYWNQFVVSASSNPDSSSSSSSSSSFPAKPCGFAFSGAAYQGLQIATLVSSSSLQYLQDHLRIVDPLYGWLRPMDVIQPYRLEMATKKLFETSSSSISTTTTTIKKTTTNSRNGTTKTQKQTKNDEDNTHKETTTTLSSYPSSTISLHDFWRPTLHECLKREMADQEDTTVMTTPTTTTTITRRRPRIILLNLASEEYSAAVLPISSSSFQELLTHVHIIKIVFQEPGGRIIGMHAKRARGLMVRYLAEHGIEDMARVKEFREEGYVLKETITIDDDEQLPTTLVFERRANWKTTTTATTASAVAPASRTTTVAKKGSTTSKPAKPKQNSSTKVAKKATKKATPETKPPLPRKRQRRGPK
jgi:cytoplasmic iron level regulating protein YaaA (DUF328/UPF0246 family)